MQDLINPKSLVITSPQKIEIDVKDDSDNESTKPLGNVITKELNKKTYNLLSSENLNAALKKSMLWFGKGGSNKQFQNKLNKLLK